MKVIFLNCNSITIIVLQIMKIISFLSLKLVRVTHVSIIELNPIDIASLQSAILNTLLARTRSKGDYYLQVLVIGQWLFLYVCYKQRNKATQNCQEVRVILFSIAPFVIIYLVRGTFSLLYTLYSNKVREFNGDFLPYPTLVPPIYTLM